MSHVKNRFKLVVLLALLFLLGLLFIVDLIGNICPLSLVAGSEGTPKIVTRKNDFLPTKISQIVADDDRIYVLYGTYSVVQVYSHEGDYQYTISVYNHLNGRTNIAAHDNHLYIQDKHDNVYVFHEDSLVTYLEREDAINSVALPYGVSDPAYYVHMGSIWKTPVEGSAQCVIHRPAILAIYQGSTIFLAQFMIMIALGFVLILFAPKKRS